MKIILKHDVLGLGDIGEVVEVRPGYARNYLIPQHMALEVNSSNAKQLAHHSMQIEKLKKFQKTEAEKVAGTIRNALLEFTLRVGMGGKVYGSIGQRDIAERLLSMGFEVDRRRVTLAEPIKKVGTHFVSVKLHPEVIVQIKVVAKPSEATREDEKGAVKAIKRQLEQASADEDTVQ